MNSIISPDQVLPILLAALDSPFDFFPGCNDSVNYHMQQYVTTLCKGTVFGNTPQTVLRLLDALNVWRRVCDQCNTFAISSRLYHPTDRSETSLSCLITDFSVSLMNLSWEWSVAGKCDCNVCQSSYFFNSAHWMIIVASVVWSTTKFGPCQSHRLETAVP